MIPINISVWQTLPRKNGVNKVSRSIDLNAEDNLVDNKVQYVVCISQSYRNAVE